MYYTASQIDNRQAAQVVALSAKAFGIALATPQHVHVPVEAVVASISKDKGLPPESVMKQLAQLPGETFKKAVEIGISEISKGFGSETQTMEFFRRVAEPRNAVRFGGIAGISHDIVAARNLLQVSAAEAYVARQASEVIGIIPQERAYVDLVKSIRRTAEVAIDAGTLDSEVAGSVVTELERSVEKMRFPGMSDCIEPLHAIARDELYEESLARMREKYAVSPAADSLDL